MEVSEASGISLLEDNISVCRVMALGSILVKQKIPAGTHCCVVLHRIDNMIMSNIPKKAHWKILVSHFVHPWPMQADMEFSACRNWGAQGSSYFLKKIFSLSKLIFLILCVLIIIGRNYFLWDYVCLVLVWFWLRGFFLVGFWCFRHFQMEFATTFI